MRKAASLAVMTVGLVVLALAITALVWNRITLPALSTQTEVQWAAYRLHGWAFLLGELSLALGLLLGGYLLWPGRLVKDSLVRPLAAVMALVGLAALGATGFVVYSAVQYREPFLQAPWLAIQGVTLLGGLAVLAVLAVRKVTGQLPGDRMASSGKTASENHEEVSDE